MGKSDENQTKQSAHKATDGESKHKNKPSFDETRNSKWRDYFRQLCEFKEQFGHSLVSGKYSVNPKLGTWATNQRTNYRLYQDGKPSPMTTERMRELESIGFELGTSKTDVASIWSVRFQEMLEFKVQFGHCVVPVKYSANPKLGQWVSTQRSNYKRHQAGKSRGMTEERIRELDSVGFDWGTRKTGVASIWSVRVQQLCEYKAEFGHYQVPHQYAANPKLGWWVSNQRAG
jgi:hypothetical protein